MAFAALLVATAFLFVWPRQDRPGRPDAVVVLSGSRIERLPKGLRVRAETGARVLVISGGLDPKWHQARRLCLHREHVSFRVICFRPRPNSTRGEAEEVRRLARRYAWRRIAVVTSTYHVFRARILFRRCLDHRIAVLGARPPLWRDIEGTAEEWPKLLFHLAFDRGC
jgi:uncharacterized SAM-binding protein YcdF (DUF218 family)